MSDQRDGGIAWTEETWNPIRGCSRVSEGCRHCYAERMAARFSGPGQPYDGLARSTPSGPRWTGKVRLVEEHLADPLRWKRPRRVFVNSMSDLFHEALSNEQIAAIFGVMAAAPQHTFQVLTKRAKRMREWFVGGARPNIAVYDAAAEIVAGDWSKMPSDMAKTRSSGGAWWPLPNVWLGVSVEDQATADARIPHLLETPAAVRWVSYEPALGPVRFDHLDADAAGHAEWCQIDALTGRHTDMGRPCPDAPSRLDWIVIGGESGPGARPFDVAWARATIAACRAAGVPCFVKQLGARPVQAPAPPVGRYAFAFDDRKGGDPAEWPVDLRVREWPSAEGAR